MQCCKVVLHEFFMSAEPNIQNSSVPIDNSSLKVPTKSRKLPDDLCFADDISIEENTSDYRDLDFSDEETDIVEHPSKKRLNANESSNLIDCPDCNCFNGQVGDSNNRVSPKSLVTGKNIAFNELYMYKRAFCRNQCSSNFKRRPYETYLDDNSIVLNPSPVIFDQPQTRSRQESIYLSKTYERGSSPYKIRKQQSLSSTEEEFWDIQQELIPNSSKGDKDCKKKVRFYVSKMEGDLNFRVTLSIKNEANGQTVFYKEDKNRFRKEKTIKLMVETMYRIDISFKPTQTLIRALIGGEEVKVTERVHDSTASAYSLHLPTTSMKPSPKGHREEIAVLIQLANGAVLQTVLQVKFYKLSDTQHSEWGSTFHCVEFDCESFEESGTISVLRETFR